MGHSDSSRAESARNERRAQDEAFGLYVARPKKQARRAEPAERSAPINEPLSLTSALGRGTLASVVVAGAVLLGAIVLGQLEHPLGGTSHNPRASLANSPERSGTARRIAVASTIVAEPSRKTPLQVKIASPDQVPASSFVHVQGLPPDTSLSEGYALGAGAWALSIASLSRLNVDVAARASGIADVRFTLVSASGESLAEAKTVLIIGRGAATTPVAVASRSLDSKLDPQPSLRPVRYDIAKPALGFSRDVSPRVAVHDRAARKRWVRHAAKRRHELATKVRRPKTVRTAEGMGPNTASDALTRAVISAWIPTFR